MLALAVTLGNYLLLGGWPTSREWAHYGDQIELGYRPVLIIKPTTSETKTHLYDRGDQKNDITGGYKFNVIQSSSTSQAFNSDNMYMYAKSVSGVGYGEIELTTNNSIDISSYDKLNIRLDYSVTFSQSDWRVHFYYGLKGANSRIIDIPGTNSATDKTVTIDISDLTGEYKPYFKAYSAASGGPVSATIKEIWLTN